MRPIRRREQSTLDRLDQVSLRRHPTLGLVFDFPRNLQATRLQVSHTTFFVVWRALLLPPCPKILFPLGIQSNSVSNSKQDSIVLIFQKSHRRFDSLDPRSAVFHLISIGCYRFPWFPILECRS